MTIGVNKRVNSRMLSGVGGAAFLFLSTIGYLYLNYKSQVVISLFISWFFLRQNSKITKDIFSPLSIMTALFLIGFVVRPLMVMERGDFYNINWPIHNKEEVRKSVELALFYGQQGFVMLCTIYIMFLAEVATNGAKSLMYYVRGLPIRMAQAATICSMVVYIAYLAINGVSFSNFIPGVFELDKTGMYIYQYGSMLIIPANISYFLYLHKRKNNLIHKLCYLIHLIVTLLISISFHDRKWFILTLLGLFLVNYYMDVNRGKAIKGALVFLGLSLLLVLLLQLRNYAVAGVSDDRSLYTLYLEHFVFGGVFGYFDYFCYELLAMPSIEKTNILNWLLYLIGSFIPNGLYSALELLKPLSFNVLIAQTLSGVAAAPAFSLFGEGYFIGGWVGVIFLSGLTGLFLTSQYNRFLITGRIINYVIVIMFFALCIRTGISGSIVGWLLFSTVFFVFRAMYSLFCKNRPRVT